MTRFIPLLKGFYASIVFDVKILHIALTGSLPNQFAQKSDKQLNESRGVKLFEFLVMCNLRYIIHVGSSYLLMWFYILKIFQIFFCSFPVQTFAFFLLKLYEYFYTKRWARLCFTLLCVLF